MELYELTAHELREKTKKREVSSEEIVRSVYNRITQVEDKLHSFVTLTEEEKVNCEANWQVFLLLSRTTYVSGT